MIASVRVVAMVILVLASGLGPVTGRLTAPVAIPGVGTNVEEICSVDIPASYIPNAPATVAFFRTTAAPGMVIDYPIDAVVPGAAFDCLQAGAYTVTIGSDVRIDRGSQGRMETFPGGKGVEARAGDTVLFLDMNQPQQFIINPDESQVTISAGIFAETTPPCVTDNSCPTLPQNVTSESLGGIDSYLWSQSGLQGQDVRMTIRRVTLNAGASRTVAASDPATTWFVESGRVIWTLEATGQSTPLLTFRSGNAIPYFPPKGDALVILRNDQAAPVVLLELAIAAVTPATATPAP